MQKIKLLHQLHKFLMWIETDLPNDDDFKSWMAFNSQNYKLFFKHFHDQWVINHKTNGMGGYGRDLQLMITNVESSYQQLCSELETPI